MSDKLKEIRGRLEERRAKLHEVFEQAGEDLDMSKVVVLQGDSAAKVEQIRAMNDEIDDLAKQAEDLDSLAQIRGRVNDLDQVQPHPGHANGGGRPVARGTLGDLFVESVAYKGYGRGAGIGPVATLDVELGATLFETGAGWAPETMRTGRVVEAATRPVQVTDLIPQTPTSQAAVVYMEETTFDNEAAEVAEGGQYAEGALALTEKSSTVKKIAVFLPVTDEQLEDVPQARGYVNNRLPFMLRQRLDGQIVVGDGAGANLRGFLNVVGIQTQAKGADPTPDAVYKAMTKARVTGRSMPGGVIFHPNDWQDIRLLRTADGIYIWGNPSEAGPERIWGLPVAQADSITENTALVGDFANFSELAVRRGIEIQVSNSHSDFFIKGKQAIRADVRVALVVYRPAAFVTVTGI